MPGHVELRCIIDQNYGVAQHGKEGLSAVLGDVQFMPDITVLHNMKLLKDAIWAEGRSSSDMVHYSFNSM